MSQSTTNKAVITHIYPKMSLGLDEPQKAISAERESDVWYELRELTLDEEPGHIYVLTHDITPDGEKYFTAAMQKGDCEMGAVQFAKPYKVERHDGEKAVTKSRIYPRNLSSKWCAEQIIKERKDYNSPITALVLFQPEEWQLEYLDKVVNECPGLPVIIFHTYHCDKYGVEREGFTSDNWEDAFPALADVEFSPQEVIVDEMLIAGNIHLISAPPESYKTMQLIELSSAVLEQRPVFDLLKVSARYPIMFLCADMSQEQLDFYAAPFNLRKHGGDFRVMKCGYGIPNITDPVLQKAVKGRILILDTMLDFAHIQKAFESGEWNTFMENLRFLMTAHGCVAVVMTAHTTRAEVKSDSDTINKAEYFKDSVTFHGKTDIGFGCKVLKNTSQVKIERIKGRGFKKTYFSFTISVCDGEGNSNLDRGRFPVCTRPEDMKELTEQRKAQVGRKSDPQLKLKMELAAKTPGSLKDKAAAVNAEYGSTHQASTIKRWFDGKEFDQEATA